MTIFTKVIFYFLCRPCKLALNNNQHQGCREQKALFGVLATAVQETEIQVIPKEYSGEEKESGTYKGKSHEAVL